MDSRRRGIDISSIRQGFAIHWGALALESMAILAVGLFLSQAVKLLPGRREKNKAAGNASDAPEAVVEPQLPPTSELIEVAAPEQVARSLLRESDAAAGPPRERRDSLSPLCCEEMSESAPAKTTESRDEASAAFVAAKTPPRVRSAGALALAKMPACWIFVLVTVCAGRWHPAVGARPGGQYAERFGEDVMGVAENIIPRVEKLKGSFLGETVPEIVGAVASSYAIAWLAWRLTGRSRMATSGLLLTLAGLLLFSLWQFGLSR